MCKLINRCYKIAIILDKEMEPEQYQECVRKVCGKCEGKGGSINEKHCLLFSLGETIRRPLAAGAASMRRRNPDSIASKNS